MKRRVVLGLAAALAMTVALPPAWAQETVRIANISELSGPGATSGVNWRDGAKMAIEEINASGGILGSQVELAEYDSQSDAQTSRAMVQKAIDEGAFALLGTVYSGSTIVNMLVAQQAGIPQFTGSESARITAMGNPYIFRTSFGSQKSMPKIADYMEKEMGVKKVAIVWANTEFGKAGYDAFVAEMEARGIEIVADVPTENAQADFAADVVNVKNSDAEAIFVYLTEEESARFLREAKKQGVSQPLVGETTLIGQKVIDLAGDAADGAMGHVGLTPDAPNPQVQEMAARFEAEFGYRPDHNAIKGYIGAYAIKYATEQVGEFDSEKIAEHLHGLKLLASEHPGILIDVSWDDTGELSRESYLVEVEDGKQVVTATLPAN
jgi:branched-chain amino acid transport system substrate-binding protein